MLTPTKIINAFIKGWNKGRLAAIDERIKGHLNAIEFYREIGADEPLRSWVAKSQEICEARAEAAKRRRAEFVLTKAEN